MKIYFKWIIYEKNFYQMNKNITTVSKYEYLSKNISVDNSVRNIEVCIFWKEKQSLFL